MTIAERVTGVLRLDAAAFEEIEADRSATPQALAIVIAGSLVYGLGSGAQAGPAEMVYQTLISVVGWILWGAVTYVVGAILLPEPETQSDLGELLRVLGYSWAPNLFSSLALATGPQRLLSTVIELWIMSAMVVGVRQALDYRSTFRAVAVVLSGLLVFVLITEIAGDQGAP